MKVAIIGTVGIPAKYGGFETLVEQLISHNKSNDLEYAVYCSSKAYKFHRWVYNGAKIEYVSFKANGFQSIIYDILSLIKATHKSDIILVLGVSGCIFLPIYRLFSKRKLIINIDGLEHKRAKWSKFIKKFLKYSEKLAIKYGDAIISDNKGIYDYVLDEYKLKSELIAYGGDHALLNSVSSDTDKTLNEFNLEFNNYALAVCRIEPENNIEMILEAFRIQKEKKIIIIGNWDSNEYAKELKGLYDSCPNIILHSPIYDLDILSILRNNCNIYIHGHSAGGTNPSLVEAMFYGKPIFAYDCIYNRETTDNQALYFNTSTDIIKLLKSTSLKESGVKMKEIAKRRYLWDIIVKQYENLYCRVYNSPK